MQTILHWSSVTWSNIAVCLGSCRLRLRSAAVFEPNKNELDLHYRSVSAVHRSGRYLNTIHCKLVQVLILWIRCRMGASPSFCSTFALPVSSLALFGLDDRPGVLFAPVCNCSRHRRSSSLAFSCGSALTSSRSGRSVHRHFLLSLFCLGHASQP